MIDELGSTLRSDEQVVYDKNTIAELRTFVRNERGSMSGSPYDDRVMALALANQMRKFAHSPEFAPDNKSQYWTLDWFAEMVQKPGVGDGFTIGQHTVRGTP